MNSLTSAVHVGFQHFVFGTLVIVRSVVWIFRHVNIAIYTQYCLLAVPTVAVCILTILLGSCEYSDI